MSDPPPPDLPTQAPPSTDAPPDAVVATRGARRRISAIWAIPVVAALIAGWLAWRTLSQQGPTITLTFQTAAGLAAGKSQVKHKDVQMGMVRTIALSKDLSHVVLTIDMTREADPLLTDRAQFWVVKPRLFAGSISGLDTVLSGSYIELRPGPPGQGKPQRDFTGLEDPPVLQSVEPGRTFLLRAERLGSISLGAPVFYRDLDVGTVLGWDLEDMARRVTVHAFVRAPFDQYVTDQSHFWNASGLTVKLGAEGVQVQLESLRAVVLGGVAFDTPAPGTASAESHAFTLYASRETADAARFQRRFQVVSYFDGSVRGLAVGAPVELRGIRVGTVTGVNLEYDPASDQVRVPVRYEVEPERVLGVDSAPLADPQQAVRKMVEAGLRAQLQSANLVTGQMLVALDTFATAPAASLGREGDVMVIPTMPGQFADLSRSVGDILAKVNNLPFDQIGQSLKDALEGVAQVTSGPELRQSLQSLQATLATVRDVARNLDAGASPMLKKLPAIAADLQDTLARASKLVGSADAGYGASSKFKRDLDRLLGQLDDTARSVRVLADLLSRHPEALVRGRTGPSTEP